MENVVTVAKWLQRGRQRAAVARVLRKPMTAWEICRAARQINPRIQIRDLWFIIPQLVQRELVRCLNRRRSNGQLYCLTDQGRAVVAAAFAVDYDGPPKRVNWRKYGDVVRAKTRRVVLEGLGRLIERTGEAQTAASMRKFLRSDHPVGLNSVSRALRDLQILGLIKNTGRTQKRGRKLYVLTQCGLKILEQLCR